VPIAGQVLYQLHLVKIHISSLLINKRKSQDYVPRDYSAPIKVSENFDAGLKSSKSWLIYKQV